MVRNVAIYVEGGGQTSATKDPLRRGLAQFLKPVVDVVREKRIRWRLVVCGGRQQAYEAFVDAVENEPDVYNMLLVDSEEPIPISTGPWTHLRNRRGDAWQQPPGADDARCHLMVACMEAWFLADPAGLKRHFGSQLNESKLPRCDEAESRGKDAIYIALNSAVAAAPAREYQKIRDGAKLLETIDPGVVRMHCKWCNRLFNTLGTAIGATV